MSRRLNKSPLHPSALRLNDLTPGRRILEFNREFGIIRELVILGYPYVATVYGGGKFLQVPCRNTRSGHAELPFLADMGVLPYDNGSWNPANFTIDHRKRHLLPEPRPMRHALDTKDDFFCFSELDPDRF